MELKRVMGRLAPRWPVLLIVGLIGAIGAFVFVEQRNAEVEPVYRAEAAVEITVAEQGSARGAPSEAPEELSAALELAQMVNETELRHENRFVNADTETNNLVFSAIEDSEEAAIAAATEMRQTYVAADPSFDVDAELAAKLTEAAVISDRLGELIPVPPDPVLPTPEEAATSEAQLTILEAEEAALNAKINELQDAKIESTDSAEIAGIDEDLAKYQADLQALLVVLRPLQAAADAAAAEAEPAAPDDGQDTYPDLPIEDQWTIQALQERLAELQTESATLIVANVTGASIDLPDVEVIDESPSVTPTWLGMLVGFIAGILLWSAILVGFDRARGVIWQAGDLKNVAILAEGPAIGMGTQDVSDLELHRRKRSVQAIRSAIIGAGRLGEGTIVGFAAPPSTDPYVRDELAFDVAASVSAVGRSVLFIDLGFTENSFLRRQGQSRTGLRALFDSVADDEATIRERASAAIQAADHRSHGLDVLTADSDVIDPADILAGRPLTELLNQARERYDIVLVVQPSTTVNTGAGVDAYLQQQVIVCTRGKTRVSEVNSIAIRPDAAHVQLVGAAILVPESSADKRRPDTGDGSVYPDGGEGPDGRGIGKVSSALKRLGANERDVSDKSLDRLRALESYSVEESALLQSSEPSERS